MEEMKKEQIPQIGSRLRQHILKIPEAVFQASGIIINGRRIKSFVFTTDLAIIRNCDADAVFAVYPFTPQQAISDAISDLNLLAVSNAVDIPVIITVTHEGTDIASRLQHGAAILNIACGKETPNVVRKIRSEFPNVPLVASGGKTNESIYETIVAGANAITYTPPSTQELFKELMAKYRT